MKITFSAPPKNVDEKMLYNILRDYKMLNCEVLVRDENSMYTAFRCFHALTDLTSLGGRLYRRDHERPPNLYQMVSDTSYWFHNTNQD